MKKKPFRITKPGWYRRRDGRAIRIKPDPAPDKDYRWISETDCMGLPWFYRDNGFLFTGRGVTNELDVVAFIGRTKPKNAETPKESQS